MTGIETLRTLRMQNCFTVMVKSLDAPEVRLLPIAGG